MSNGIQYTIKEIEDKIPNHDKFITTAEFNKVYGTIFPEKLKQKNVATGHDIADFIKKTYFNEKQRNIDNKATLNETKQLEAETKLTDLSKKFDKHCQKIKLGRMFLTDVDSHQNAFDFLPMLNTITLGNNINKKVTNWTSTKYLQKKTKLLKFNFGQNERYEIHTVLSFISPQFM